MHDGMLQAEVTSGLKLFIMEALSEPMSLEPSQHRQELVDRLDILRTNESFCDVTIAVEGKELKAHKAVLAAASPFFLTLLTSDMKESKEQLIKIELKEATAAVMEDVLKYVYTGKVLVTEERAHNLFATADYLLLPGLKTLASNFLKKVVTIENCFSNYYFADKYQCLELKEKSCQVINSSFGVVMETEDFLKLDMKQVMEWVSSDDITVGAEEEVFKGIIKWVSHNKSEREEAFPELLHQVCLTSLSRDFVLNDLPKEELILRNPEFGLNFVVDAMKLMQSATDGQVNHQPRKCLEAHLNGIFVCGGRKALCYFPQQNLWYQLADKLVDGQHCSPTQCKGKIYVLSNVHREWVMQYYIPTSNSRGAVQSDTSFSSVTFCTVCKGYLYAICLNPFVEGKIFRYDAETNCWIKVLDPPKRQWSPCIVTDEQYLYIIGGAVDVGLNAIATTTRFDFNNNKWDEVADINHPRKSAFGTAMNDKVYIAGGKQGWEDSLSSCEVYTPATNEWQLMPSLKVPRRNANMVCCEGKLYVLGGETADSQGGRSPRLLTVEEFDSDRNEWIEKSAIPVNSFETAEDKEKGNRFQACFARLCKGVINKLKPLNNRHQPLSSVSASQPLSASAFS